MNTPCNIFRGLTYITFTIPAGYSDIWSTLFNNFINAFDKDILIVNDTDQPEQGEK